MFNCNSGVLVYTTWFSLLSRDTVHVHVTDVVLHWEPSRGLLGNQRDGQTSSRFDMEHTFCLLVHVYTINDNVRNTNPRNTQIHL